MNLPSSERYLLVKRRNNFETRNEEEDILTDLSFHPDSVSYSIDYVDTRMVIIEEERF